MPPRWLCFGVVAFWMAVTGWLIWSEVRDEFGTDEPPPFFIDLTDEARPENARIRWVVWHGEGPSSFVARSWVEYREKQDDFTLYVRFEPDITLTKKLTVNRIDLQHMNSEYRVDRRGRLLGVVVDLKFDFSFGGLPKLQDVTVHMEGEVARGQFHGKYTIVSPLGSDVKEMKPVRVSHRGSVLLPTHPVSKLRGLRPGQSWKMPILDPLGDAMSEMMPGGDQPAPRSLSAHVLPELHVLPPTPNPNDPWKEISCLVIEYDGGENDNCRPRTWVRAADGLVLRQEVELDGKRLIMQRDMIPPVAGGD